MITYRAVGKRCFSENCNDIFLYSIVALDSGGRKIAEIDDVSADKDAVAELIEIMNRSCLSLVHFKDVIDDFLVMKY